MEFGNGFGSAFVGAQVLFCIGVKGTVPGSKEDDGLIRDGTIRFFPGLNIFGGYLVIGVRQGFIRNINHDGFAGQIFQWDLIRSPLAFRKMHRRIQMGTPMFGRTETIS